MSVTTHVEGSDHLWKDVECGSKDIADDHKISSPSMLYAREKEFITYSFSPQILHVSVFTVVYIIK